MNKDIYHEFCSPEAQAHRSWVRACEDAESEVRRLTEYVRVLETDNQNLRRAISTRASMMTDCDIDIISLADRVKQTGETLRIAREAWEAAKAAFDAAVQTCCAASTAFDVAQNNLLVAVGGTDRSFVLGLIPNTPSIPAPETDTGRRG